jgi:CubicO group peptidase (beta-lactamase class C family)
LIPPKATLFRDFDLQVNRVMPDWNAPGCAVAIIQDGHVVHWNGYGFRDIEKGLPVEYESVFAIGSTSKAFASASIAMLVDRSLLEWDTPVKQFLPDFNLQDEFAAERMTVRDLLCHRSGLPRHDALWYGTPFTRKQLVARLKYLQPSADFRTTFQYQNLMFMTAGYLLECVTGQTWEEFTQNNLLDPLGMRSTSLCMNGIITAKNAVRPYSAGANGNKLLPYRDLDTIAPAGGVNSCLADLVKWVSLHLEGGCYQNHQIISSENLAVTHTPATFIENSYSRLLQPFSEVGMESYGLGWFIHDYRGHRLLRHGGHIDGFSTQISFMPEIGAGVIVLSNIGGSNFMFVPTFLAYDILLGLPALDWSTRLLGVDSKTRQAGENASAWYASRRRPKTIPSHALSEFVGVYRCDAYGDITVELAQGGLKAEFNGRQIDLTHYHYNTFDWSMGRPGSVSLKANFITDWLGNIDQLQVQLEPMVDPLLFDRQPSAVLSDVATLAGYTGAYQCDGKTARVELSSTKDLRVIMPGFPELKLCPFQADLYKVCGHHNWLVEFFGKPVIGFNLIQPTAVFSAEKI